MRLLSYTPSHCDPLLLEKLTSGQARKALITTLADAVRDEVGRESHQHQLIIGPRGSGKTHVLTLVRHILKTDQQLMGKVVVVHLAEEEVIRQPADLLIRILERLVQQMPVESANTAARERIGTHLSRLRSEAGHDRALDLAAAAVEDAAQTLGVLLVATIENLDAILFTGPGLSRNVALQAHWGLRKALQQSAGLVVIASAPTMFGEVADPKAPFHDFFRTHRLEELDNDEMLALIRTRLGSELLGAAADERRRRRLQTLEDGFDERAPKLRGLLTLTGGLPRFGHLVFDLLVEVDAASIMDTLAAFLDEQTPYFQPKLDPRMVPEGELEVLDALASAPGPLTVSELAGIVRGGSPNAAVTYLKRLRARGLVRERRTGARSVHYDVAEPLFRIWRRFRIGRSEQEQILMLAEFVAAMFSPAELMADRAVLRETKAADARSVEMLSQAIALTSGGAEQQPQGSEPEDDLFRTALQSAEEGDLERAMVLAEEGEIRARSVSEGTLQGAWSWLRGNVLWKLGRREAAASFQEAAGSFAQAGRDELRALCLLSRGMVLSEFAEWDDAAAAFGEAVPGLSDSSHRANAWFGRAVALEKAKRGDEAVRAYAEAAAASRSDPNASTVIIELCASALDRLGNPNEAIRVFRESAAQALQQRDYRNRARSLRSAGELLVQMDREDEAVHAFRDAADAYFRLHDPEEYSQGIWWIARSLADLMDAQTNAAALVDGFAPYLARSADQEDGRTAFVVLARAILVSQGADVVLSILPRLEGLLPESHASLLRPLRLAAEILAKRRPPAMTNEPEEMHRAVTDVVRWYEAMSERPRE